MFGKVFASCYTGSMFGAGVHVFAVWTYALANADATGTVELNSQLLAAVLGDCEPERIDAAIEYLCRPDPRSRSQKEGGRRLLREGQFQYIIVNYARYRATRDQDERRAYNREAKRRERER